MAYTLGDIATGGAAAVAVSTALTQATKRLIELKWGPRDPAHDTLVETGGLLVSVLVVLVAALLTTPAVPFAPAWWTVVLAAVVAGAGIKYGSSGLYKALTTGKVDGSVLAQLGSLAAAVEQMANSGPTAPAQASVPPSPAPPPTTQPGPSGGPQSPPGPPAAPAPVPFVPSPTGLTTTSRSILPHGVQFAPSDTHIRLGLAPAPEPPPDSASAP